MPPTSTTIKSPEPDLKNALARVRDLMTIPGPSGREEQVADYIRQSLVKAGASASHIKHDEAHAGSELGGTVGNLIFKLRGTQKKKPRRMLVAHMDTVPLCVGCEPKEEDGFFVSANPETGLGADNRAGVAVILTAAIEILQQKLPHPPLTFLFAVQEEVGLVGARNVSLGMLGKPELAFNWDGGAPEKLTVGATGAYRMRIEIEGVASHAGGAPELGVSAIAIAGMAIATLEKNGWHGAIFKDGEQGTANIGVVQGGDATNVVAPKVELRAEARSHNPKFRRVILKAYQEAFEQAAEAAKNALGVAGQVTFRHQLDYESFKLDNSEPCVLTAEEAVRAVGEEPIRAVCNGGLDANWLTERGIPTVSLGAGQENQHTVAERLDIARFQQACRIALRLATGTEGE